MSLFKTLRESGAFKALGIVFGDIGTSPIYTVTIIFAYLKPTYGNILGVVSLIIWTITALVTVQYLWLALGISERNEGGTIILRNIVAKYVKSAREIGFVTIVSYIALSLLIGDSVITPAISILSAVEGIRLIPLFKDTATGMVVVISLAITALLFWYQHKGTERVAETFSPIMALWFLVIGASGLISLFHEPSFIFEAINPWHAIRFIFNAGIPADRMIVHGVVSLFVLTDVILSATGGEALYADMGHIGRKGITEAWVFVFIMLIINYAGQGAFIMTHPGETNSFFQMFNSQFGFLYIPFLILSVLATIIASQAVISGMFSIVYQLINSRIIPLLKITYKSSKLQSQIYINSANWALFTAVSIAILMFKTSASLSMAYGLAVSGTMTFTSILMFIYFIHRKRPFMVLVSVFTTMADLLFLYSNLMYKTVNGGYFALIMALIPFALIMVYTKGQKRLHGIYTMTDLNIFMEKYNFRYKNGVKLEGTSLFFASLSDKVSPYIIKTMFANNIIYEKNVFVSIERTEKPFGIQSEFKKEIAPGLNQLIIMAGYFEVVDVEEILKRHGIEENVIFYGFEEIVSNNVFWKVFALIKKLSPSFVRFYKLPAEKVHGVMVRVKM